MNNLNLLYNAIENNNIKTIKFVVCFINENDLIKYNNKALSMAYTNGFYEIFDYLTSFNIIYQYMKLDPDKTLLDFYNKRKLKINLDLF